MPHRESRKEQAQRLFNQQVRQTIADSFEEVLGSERERINDLVDHVNELGRAVSELATTATLAEWIENPARVELGDVIGEYIKSVMNRILDTLIDQYNREHADVLRDVAATRARLREVEQRFEERYARRMDRIETQLDRLERALEERQS